MRPDKLTATVVFFCFALQLFGCSTTKFVNPDQSPRQMTADKITVVTIDGPEYPFTEIRVIADTLYGVNGIPFPEDRSSMGVTPIPYSQIYRIGTSESDPILFSIAGTGPGGCGSNSRGCSHSSPRLIGLEV